ncbi:MAG: universal stress protein [Rectinemataceae bacterium]
MKQLFRTVVVAINGSEGSIAAFKYALGAARLYGTRIVAAYVIDTATISRLYLSRIFVSDEKEAFERSLEESGRHYLKYCTELAAAKKLSIETRLLRGSVAGEIVKLAMELDADCIVVGSPHSDLRRGDAIMEANREIAASSRCPVLMVPPKSGDSLYAEL